MANNDGTEPSAETSAQPPEYYYNQLSALKASIVDGDIKDDGLWYTLRVAMEGWREQDFKKWSYLANFRDTLMKHGVFVDKPRPGETLASVILKAIEGDYMREWTKEMADALKRHRPILTIDPDLQALLGREGVDPRYWQEPYAAAQVPSEPVTAPPPVVPSTAPKVETVASLSLPTINPSLNGSTRSGRPLSPTTRLRIDLARRCATRTIYRLPACTTTVNTAP